MTPERQQQIEDWGKQKGEEIARNLFLEGKALNMDKAAIFLAYQHALLISLSHLFSHDMSKAEAVLILITKEVSSKLKAVEQAMVAKVAANDFLKGIFKGNQT